MVLVAHVDWCSGSVACIVDFVDEYAWKEVVGRLTGVTGMGR